jgi:CRISPR-associated exonuclease Cas4
MDDDSLLPISALQHLVFCRRQCALIHLEGAWSDNRLTAEGNLLHERVESGETTTRGALRVYRAMPLVSRRLGLVGKSDIVEIHRAEDGGEQPFPVEYKRGVVKEHDADRVQLCAQALCLEEMLGTPIPAGALFYGQPRRREPVVFTPALRAETEALATELHRLIEQEIVPPPEPGPKCRSCSLEEICRPFLAERKSAAAWLERARAEG